MSAYTMHDIRNIALVGQAGAGKTTLAEALLAKAGAIAKPGSTAKGDTVADFDAQEQAAGHSLDTSILHFSTGGNLINLLDTPGYPDLIGRAMNVLPAIETMALVLDARNGVDGVAQRMMEAATQQDHERLIIMNHIDAPEANPEALLAEVQAVFGSECLPLNLPSQDGSQVIDCFFAPQPAAVAFSSVEAAHEAMVDQVVEVDEELMAVYLEQGQNLSPEQLHDPFEQAMREGHLIPVCFVSAQTGAGVDALLEIFARLMPDPSEGNPPRFLKGEGGDIQPVDVSPNPDAHAIGHVFKTLNDPYRGKLSAIRLHQGRMTPQSQLFIGDARKAFKPGHLYRLQGKETVDIDAAVPGEIFAVAKVDDLHFDAIVHDSHDEDHYHFQSMVCPAPVHGLAIHPLKQSDEQKLADALNALRDEDPCLGIERGRDQTVLRGLGQMHLDVVIERLKNRYNVAVETSAPTVAYRETITQQAEGHYRHKKQTGGAGQFGEVYLRIEPLERGAGFEFASEVVGGAIPGQFIPSVEKGVHEAMAEGVVAGYPLQDVRVVVYDGKTHPVDGKEVAFISAGKHAMQAAVQAAEPVVLEPLVSVEVTCSAEQLGDITGDLSSRRGRISGTEHLANDNVKVSALVPLAEIGHYEAKLKSMTGGSGRFTLSYSHYEAVPAQVQKSLAAAFANKQVA